MISAAANGLSKPAATNRARVVPFDYAFRFKLEGKPERVVNQTVAVSIEAPFVAVSIGYGVVPEPLKLTLPPPPPRATLLAVLGNLLPVLAASFSEADTLKVQVGPRTAAALRTGIRLNPTFADLALGAGGTAQLQGDAFRELFQLVAPPPEQVQFLYALFDEGTGREFQSEPLLNTAGLGTPSGDRPFRYFARPIVFGPRATIRMQVTEVSEFVGDLHVSLHGYKALGGGQTSADARRRSARRRS